VVLPPAHASAALHLHRHAGDAPAVRAFLEEAFPHLEVWHEYLYMERDLEGEGLVYIRHSWESGMDDSPMWDSLLQRLHLHEGEIPSYRRADTQTVSSQDRPTSASYDRFAYLVKFFAERCYDEERIRDDCPFLVQDVLFNTLMYKSEKDLAEIARVLGQDPSPFEERSQKTARAINEKLWDEEKGTYLDYDLRSGAPIRAYLGPNLIGPLYAGVPHGSRAGRVVESLENDGFGLADENVTPVPSCDIRGFGYSPEQYWRGPVWINMDWFLMHRLEDYGYTEYAERLRQTIVDLCEGSGFHEYFDPVSTEGHGSVLFSWSALLLDVLLDEGR
jgi:hypothetical protein